MKPLTNPFRNYDDLIEFLENAGLKLRKLGKDWQGNWVVATGIPKKFLVVAGSHGDEHAGVVAATSLAAELGIPVVPSRDPAGVNGFLYALEFLTDRKPPSKDYPDVLRFVKETADWVYDKKGFVVGVYQDIAVCAMPPKDPWKGEDEVNDRLEKELKASEELAQELEGKRVLIPANLPFSEGVGLFDRLFTSFVIRSEVRNYNRLFDIQGPLPDEFKNFKAFIDNFAPQYSFDLHEGYGDGFYAFLPFSEDEFSGEEADLYLAVFKRIKEVLTIFGLKITTVSEAEKLGEEKAFLVKDPEEIALIGMPKVGERCFSGYMKKVLGKFSVTFETGMRADFKSRVFSHRRAVIAALEYLTSLEVQ